MPATDAAASIGAARRESLGRGTGAEIPASPGA